MSRQTAKTDISAEEFDRLFDEGKEDITPFLDLKAARRPGLETRRVNVDFPAWMIEAMDKEASRLGITRQALIKVTMGDRLDKQGRRCE